MASVLNVYPLGNYTFGTKEPKMEKDTSVADRLARMKANYMKEGMRTSVEAILLVIEHNQPHILLLQTRNKSYELPGGRLKPGENEIEGLKRKLCSKLAVNSPSFPPNWQVGECVAMWWRLNFETEMYPCCPPQTTKPKECKKLFIVHLSEREYFDVPRNLKLLAVPLSELSNLKRYGHVISNIQHHLSRFQLNTVHPSKADHCIIAPNDRKSQGQGIVTIPEDDIQDAAHEEEPGYSKSANLCYQLAYATSQTRRSMECSKGLLKDGVLSRASKDGYTVNQADPKTPHIKEAIMTEPDNADLLFMKEGGGRGQRSVSRLRTLRRGSPSPLPLLALDRPHRFTWSEDHTRKLYECCVEEMESLKIKKLSADCYTTITEKINEKGATCTLKMVKDKLNATKKLYCFYLKSRGKDDGWWDKNLKTRGAEYKNLRYKPPKHVELIEIIFASENSNDGKSKVQGTGTISEDDTQDAAHEEEVKDSICSRDNGTFNVSDVLSNFPDISMECSKGLLEDGVVPRASKDGYTINQKADPQTPHIKEVILSEPDNADLLYMKEAEGHLLVERLQRVSQQINEANMMWGSLERKKDLIDDIDCMEVEELTARYKSALAAVKNNPNDDELRKALVDAKLKLKSTVMQPD